MSDQPDQGVERLRAIVEASGLTVVDFAERLGEKPQRLKDILRGKTRLPGEIVLKLPEVFGVRAEYLFGQDVPPFQESSPYSGSRALSAYSAKSPHVEYETEFVFVNLYSGAVSAGNGNEEVVERKGAIAFRRDWLRRRRQQNPDMLAAFEIKGDSMEPTLHEGDLVVFNLAETVVDTSGIYLYSLGEQRYVKRLVPVESGDLRVISDNPRYGPTIIDEEVAESRGLKVIGRFFWRGGDRL